MLLIESVVVAGESLEIVEVSVKFVKWEDVILKVTEVLGDDELLEVKDVVVVEDGLEFVEDVLEDEKLIAAKMGAVDILEVDMEEVVVVEVAVVVAVTEVFGFGTAKDFTENN